MSFLESPIPLKTIAKCKIFIRDLWVRILQNSMLCLLVLESQCCGFSLLEPRCLAFCALKKCLGITMSWLSCLCRFWMRWWFSPRITMSCFFGFGILMTWFFGLQISMSWYMCLHSLAFVFIKSIMPQN